MSDNKKANGSQEDVATARTHLYELIKKDGHTSLSSVQLSSSMSDAGFVKISGIDGLFSWVDEMLERFESNKAARKNTREHDFMNMSLASFKQDIVKLSPEKKTAIGFMVKDLWLPSPSYPLEDDYEPRAISLQTIDGSTRLAIFQGLTEKTTRLYEKVENRDLLVFVHELSHANAIVSNENQEAVDSNVPTKWKAGIPSQSESLLNLSDFAFRAIENEVNVVRHLLKRKPADRERDAFSPEMLLSESRADIISLYLISKDGDDFDKRRDQLIGIRESRAVANMDIDHRTSKALLRVKYGDLTVDNVFDVATDLARKGLDEELLRNRNLEPVGRKDFAACLAERRELKARQMREGLPQTASALSCGKPSP